MMKKVEMVDPAKLLKDFPCLSKDLRKALEQAVELKAMVFAVFLITPFGRYLDSIV